MRFVNATLTLCDGSRIIGGDEEREDQKRKECEIHSEWMRERNGIYRANDR